MAVGNLLEKMLEVRKWIAIARAETMAIKKLCDEDSKPFSRVEMDGHIG